MEHEDKPPAPKGPSTGGGPGAQGTACRLACPADMEALLPSARPLEWYQPGRRVEVTDRMQSGYSYVLSEPPGRGFAPGFAPELSPALMLRFGVFEGKYLNDCILELPREWYAAALEMGRLSPGRADPGLNAFGVKSRQPLAEWRRKGWIPCAPGDRDVRGWFQWYCRYWLGRREPAVDAVQIRRWRAFTRHRAQVLKSYERLEAPPRVPADMLTHRPRQRQALLQWAYNPYF